MSLHGRAHQCVLTHAKVTFGYLMSRICHRELARNSWCPRKLVRYWHGGNASNRFVAWEWLVSHHSTLEMAAETPELGLVDFVGDLFYFILFFTGAPSSTMDEFIKKHHKLKVSGIGLQLWGRIRGVYVTHSLLARWHHRPLSRLVDSNSCESALNLVGHFFSFSSF